MSLSVTSLNNQVFPVHSSPIQKKQPEAKSVVQKSELAVTDKHSDTDTAVKYTVGTAVKNVGFVPEVSKTQKISASTQTALKVSSSNGIGTSLGLAVGGATVGVVVAKIAGRKALPLALLGSSIGSLIDRSIGIAKNTDKIKESYNTGKTDATKLETALNAVGFALDVGSISGVGKLLKASSKTAGISSKVAATSEVPVSEGFRQYKTAETLVGKEAGNAWGHTITEGIPTPNQLAKIKGTSNVTGSQAFLNVKENLKMEGASIKDIVSKIPKEAQLRELTPSPTIKEGFEYAWVDKKTNMDYRVRIHGSDSGVAKHNPTSTAAQGWIVRVERNLVGERVFPKTEYLTLDGTYHKVSELLGFEKQKKEAELTIAVIRDVQKEVLGSLSHATSSASIGKVNIATAVASHSREEIEIVRSAVAHKNIEHFHHSSHMAVGGFNKAIVNAH